MQHQRDAGPHGRLARMRLPKTSFPREDMRGWRNRPPLRQRDAGPHGRLARMRLPKTSFPREALLVCLGSSRGGSWRHSRLRGGTMLPGPNDRLGRKRKPNIFRLRATSPQGERQGEVRNVSQGKGVLREQKVDQWNGVQRHAAGLGERITSQSDSCTVHNSRRQRCREPAPLFTGLSARCFRHRRRIASAPYGSNPIK